MKIRLLVAIALAAFLSFAFAPRADAQFSITISFDENGNGLFTLTGLSGPLSSQALPSALQTDPGPGGLPNALTYGLLGPPGLVGGNVALLEPECPAGGICIGDLIRFNPTETIAGTIGVAVFYSLNDGDNSLADIGVPTVQGVLFGVFEINGVATYTPDAGEPGFIAGAAGPTTYVITSDIPVPATLPLFATGLVGLGLLGWRRNRKAQAV